jgi:hypothetical protein
MVILVYTLFLPSFVSKFCIPLNSAPTSLSFLPTLGNEPHDVAVSGSYAYLAVENQGLRVINIALPSSPFEVGHMVTTWAIGVAVSGEFAYVINGGSGLSIINIADPTHPKLAGFLSMPGFLSGVAVSGSYAYITAEENGLRVVDVSTPASPVEIGFYQTPGTAEFVRAAGNTISVAALDGGLIILQFNPGGATYTIRGRVTNSLGNPVPDVSISAGAGFETLTNANGDYILSNLNPGTYTITASKTNFTFLPPLRTVDVPPNAVSQDFSSLNHAPLLDTFTTPYLSPIQENNPPPSNAGTLVIMMIASTLPVDLISDEDTGAQEGIAVIGIDDAHGVWQFSMDNGATWTDFGSPSAVSARLLASDSTTRLRFLPVTEFFGSATITFRAWDRTSGSAGQTADTTTNGGTTAFSTAITNAVINVNCVNEPPTFDPIANLTVPEDSGSHIVNLAGISSGGSDENDFLTVTAVSSNTSIIPNPTVDYTSPNSTGTLSFTPVAHANGIVNITVTFNDGQPANNIFSRTFTVTVNPVNDPPLVTDFNQSVRAGYILTFSADDFESHYSDIEDAPLAKIKIISLPTHGTLKLSGEEVTPGQEINVAEISSLTYTPEVGGTIDSFEWNGSDGELYALVPAGVNISILSILEFSIFLPSIRK